MGFLDHMAYELRSIYRECLVRATPINNQMDVTGLHSTTYVVCNWQEPIQLQNMRCIRIKLFSGGGHPAGLMTVPPSIDQLIKHRCEHEIQAIRFCFITDGLRKLWYAYWLVLLSQVNLWLWQWEAWAMTKGGELRSSKYLMHTIRFSMIFSYFNH